VLSGFAETEGGKMEAVIRQEIDLMRFWVQRHRSDGIEPPPTDVIWQTIGTFWPGLSEEQKQRILLVLDIVPVSDVMSQ
jgi:hypothetical protein